MTETTQEFEDLRRRFEPRAMGPDDAKRAYQLGWSRAQDAYLARERERAHEGMTALMARRGRAAPVDLDDAYDLLELAFRTFNVDGTDPGVTHRDEDGGALVLSVIGCPTQPEPRARAICSERVCPYWHRRQGWIEALGLTATDRRDASAAGVAGGCTSVVALRGATSSDERAT